MNNRQHKLTVWKRRVGPSPLIAVLLVLFAGCKPSGTAPASQPKSQGGGTIPVTVTAARRGDVESTVTVTGSLVALQDVALSARQGGRVATLTVREGDSVVAGQVVARIDSTDLQSQVRADEAAVASDQAKLAQTQAAYDQQRTTTETDIASARAVYQQQVTTSAAQVRSAQAALAGAQAALSTQREGARPEERTETQATLASAEANRKKAQSDLGRYEKLHAAGAVSDAEMDQYRNARDVAEATLNSARAAVTLQQNGNRRQDIQQAEATVRQSQSSLRQAQAARTTDAVKKAALQAALAEKSQNEVKLADVRAAQADVIQAQNTLTIARQAVTDTVVRSPLTGRVSSRSAEPGQIVTSATTLLHIVALDSVYFEPSVPDTALGQIRVGQSVTVQADAFAGRTFQGTVTRIYPEGSSTSRTFPVRITIQNPNGSLRPQMFAQGQIQTEVRRQVVLVPRQAILGSGDMSAGHRVQVFTVENGVAHKRTVTLGLSTTTGDWIEAQGLASSAQVITLGQRTLDDGQQVTATSSTALTTAANTATL